NIFYDAPNVKERYQGNGGPVFRMISDFTDHTSVYLTADNGIDQSQLLNNQMYNSMEEMYNKGRMFRLPTNEI
ncbi:MAG: hypothetical protein ACKO96_08345, partial [Flammeovirgaceae bacterium]